jgi:hypothetical protein
MALCEDEPAEILGGVLRGPQSLRVHPKGRWVSGPLSGPIEIERTTEARLERALGLTLFRIPLLIPACLVLGCASLSSEPLPKADSEHVESEPETVSFVGEIHEDEDLSAVAAIGSFLLVGSDETRQIQVLERRAEHEYHVVGEPIELLPSGGEIDIEAITTDGHRVFVAGSHSLTRKKTKKSKTYLENRARLETVSHEPNRDHLFALDFEVESGQVGSIRTTSLREVLSADDILALFTPIPGKENGIDIEGMAARGDRLFVGFRSPVLRQSYVPILETSFSKPTEYKLLFVDLKGNGIRDMLSVPDGLILLAGPPGSADGPFFLFAWDGSDGLKSSGNPAPRLLLEISPPVGGKAEGIALIESRGACHRLLLLFDGIAGGAPQILEVCTD